MDKHWTISKKQSQFWTKPLDFRIRGQPLFMSTWGQRLKPNNALGIEHPDTIKDSEEIAELEAKLIEQENKQKTEE